MGPKPTRSLAKFVRFLQNALFKLVGRCAKMLFLKQFLKVTSSETVHVGGMPSIVKLSQDREAQKLIKERVNVSVQCLL